MKDPGFEVDVAVHSYLGAVARVWGGHLGWAEAVRSGGIKLTGRRAIVQAFPGWLELSHFAHVLQPARARVSVADERRPLRGQGRHRPPSGPSGSRWAEAG